MCEPTSPAVSSGLVIDGVENAASLATRLLDSLWWIRRCGIAIANDTRYFLRHPQRYEAGGRVVSMPMQIGPEQTGLIGAYKTAALASGTSGVITYQVEGLSGLRRYLQVMWSVPYAGKNWVNVALGEETASERLFGSMFEGTTGHLCRARDTAYTEPLLEGGPIVDVYMSAESHAVLVVQLRPLP